MRYFLPLVLSAGEGFPTVLRFGGISKEAWLDWLLGRKWGFVFDGLGYFDFNNNGWIPSSFLETLGCGE